jgi:hypothetical protein
MFDMWIIALFLTIFSSATLILGIVIIKGSRKTHRRKRKVEPKPEPIVEVSEKSSLDGLLKIVIGVEEWQSIDRADARV